MISLFILSIVSVAVIKNLSTAIRQSADLKDSLEARWVAEDYMTRMQMLPKTSENFPLADSQEIAPKLAIKDGR